MTENEYGVLYVAVGNNIMQSWAMHSAVTLRATGYTGPIAFVSDNPNVLLSVPNNRQLIYPPDNCLSSIGKTASSAFLLSRLIKSNAYNFTPWNRTLMVDSDTVFMADPTDKLKSFDGLAMVPDQDLLFINDKYSTAERVATQAIFTRQETIRQVNSGVIFFSKPFTKPLFLHWNSQYTRFCGYDQAALMRALALSSISRQELGFEWNNPLTRDSFDKLSPSSKIVHFYADMRFYQQRYATQLLAMRSLLFS